MNDCSWCAQEASVTPSASPTICPRHEALLLEQLAARQAARSAAKEEKTEKQRKAA
jgi:hypothetical protein